MRRTLIALRIILPICVLLLLNIDTLKAQDPPPIRAEEARMELIRQVPISTEVTGKLKTVSPSEEGRYVKQGDLMIEIEDELIRKEVAEAQKKSESNVEIEFAIVALEKAKVDLKQREDANVKFKSFTDNEIRQSKLEVQKAEAQLAKSREDKEVLGLTLETKTAQLAQYKVYAPFDGLVTKVHRWQSQSVRPGDPVLTVTDMSELRAVLKVDFKKRKEVFVGDLVEIRIDNTGRAIPVDEPTSRALDPSSENNSGDGLFRRGGPSVNEPNASASQESDVFPGTIRFIDPTLEKKTNTVFLKVSVLVPNRTDKYGRYLLQEGLPIEATIIPKKRDQ